MNKSNWQSSEYVGWINVWQKFLTIFEIVPWKEIVNGTQNWIRMPLFRFFNICGKWWPYFVYFSFRKSGTGEKEKWIIATFLMFIIYASCNLHKAAISSVLLFSFTGGIEGENLISPLSDLRTVWSLCSESSDFCNCFPHPQTFINWKPKLIIKQKHIDLQFGHQTELWTKVFEANDVWT